MEVQSDGSSLSAAALQARIQRFEQQTKIKIDSDTYKQWLSQNSRQPPRIISEQIVAIEAMTTVCLGSRFRHALVTVERGLLMPVYG